MRLSTRSTELSSQLAIVAIAASIYCLFGLIGLQICLPMGYASSLWPATGVGLVLTGRSGIFAAIGCGIGAISALLIDGSILASNGTSLANVASLAICGFTVIVQLLTGAAVMRWIASRLGETLYLFKLLPAAFICAVIVAPIRAISWATVLVHFGFVASGSLTTIATTMAGADALSTLSICSLAFFIGNASWQRLSSDVARRLTLVPLALLPTVGIMSVIALTNVEHRFTQIDFKDQSEELISLIRSKSDDDLLMLETLRSLVYADPDLSRQEFEDFASILLSRRSQLTSVALIRRVSPESRAGFEAKRSADANRLFHISTMQPGMKLEPEAQHSTDYFPVDYIVPAAAARVLEGFDVASDPARLASLKSAVERNAPTAAPAFQVNGKMGIGSLHLVELPYFDRLSPASSDTLLGFVVLRWDLSHWLNTLQIQSRSLISRSIVQISDVTDGPAVLLAQTSTPDATHESERSPPTDFVSFDELEIEGRKWTVSINLPRLNSPYLWGWRSFGYQVLPQFLFALLSAMFLLRMRRRVSRDRLEMQIAALSRRYLRPMLNRQSSASQSLVDPRETCDHKQVVEANQRGQMYEQIWQTGTTRQFYEPIVDLETGKIVGFESLLRLPAGADRRLSVYDFISWAERTGHIKALTFRSIEQALKQIAIFRAESGRKDIPWISVNVSASVIADGDLVDSMIALTQLHSASCSRLKLEVTESVYFENIELTASRLSLLKSTGLRIALDDFGTGYASLSYVHRLPLDTLKIDRSFIVNAATNINAKEIVRSMIALAAKLDLEVIAEGVEDDATAFSLLKLGCTLAQGWRFSKASPPDVITDWVRSGRRFLLNRA